ncbi:hypothetical protein HFP89_06860 [Wenzhouxiangella sp. XN79A]|uniref:hypothetical protein n=1 Tax=Wenzhouxiangella sp. XN79A TaxID=2724193 RepID=UPI00144A6366|nr:hypothetical protein [Wenzhouxiangella sp. XN79A]NKI34880.1 hypothetical protein [Wenzhouxiangella sp. XN79A]
MRRTFLLALGIFFGDASADSAWWQLCDSCTTSQQFSNAVVGAPAPHEIVYVTNRQTNTTKKFNRFTTWEDLGTGYVQMTHVYPVTMSASEEDAFESAVEKSRIVQLRVPRSDLDGLVPGVGPSESAVIDIQNGYLGSPIINAIRDMVELSGALPDHVSVSAEAGLSTPIAGANYGQGNSIRQSSLTVIINYPDGSSLQVVRNPDGSLTGWAAVDADGNVILFQAQDGSLVPVDASSIGDEYSFGPGGPAIGDAARELLEVWFREGLNCWSEPTPIGIRVNCSRP